MVKPIIIKVPARNASVVAVDSNKMVVSHGNSMKAVMDKAKKAGVKNPAIMFVPKQGQRYIY
mgnify:CR=1 FL=1